MFFYLGEWGVVDILCFVITSSESRYNHDSLYSTICHKIFYPQPPLPLSI